MLDVQSYLQCKQYEYASIYPRYTTKRNGQCPVPMFHLATAFAGGYVAIEKSTARHKPEEIEAARILADKGYKVILKDEATGLHGVKTPDGYLFKASFEQRTPRVSGSKSFSNSLEHAKQKQADIAVVYDKNRVYVRKDVEDGITRYEQYNPYRFKQIIVISGNGNIHRHKHNK